MSWFINPRSNPAEHGLPAFEIGNRLGIGHGSPILATFLERGVDGEGDTIRVSFDDPVNAVKFIEAYNTAEGCVVRVGAKGGTLEVVMPIDRERLIDQVHDYLTYGKSKPVPS